MDRRDFLKACGAVIAGILIARLTRLFNFGQGPAESSADLKEARFYHSGDDLAG